MASCLRCGQLLNAGQTVCPQCGQRLANDLLNFEFGNSDFGSSASDSVGNSSNDLLNYSFGREQNRDESLHDIADSTTLVPAEPSSIKAVSEPAQRVAGVSNDDTADNFEDISKMLQSCSGKLASLSPNATSHHKDMIEILSARPDALDLSTDKLSSYINRLGELLDEIDSVRVEERELIQLGEAIAQGTLDSDDKSITIAKWKERVRMLNSMVKDLAQSWANHLDWWNRNATIYEKKHVPVNDIIDSIPTPVSLPSMKSSTVFLVLLALMLGELYVLRSYTTYIKYFALLAPLCGIMAGKHLRSYNRYMEKRDYKQASRQSSFSCWWTVVGICILVGVFMMFDEIWYLGDWETF